MNKLTEILDENAIIKTDTVPAVSTQEIQSVQPSSSGRQSKKMTTADWIYSSHFRQTLGDIIPKHLNTDRICRIALNEFRKNPTLQECTVQSFLGAIINATTVGLEIGEVLGHAYLIPREDKFDKTKICQFHLGYKGMIELANRSGVLVTANLVYPGDEYEAVWGNEERLKHVMKPINRDKFLCGYAYIRTKDDKFKMHIMYPDEIESIRQRSPTAYKTYSPWMKDFNAMAKKTVIRQLFKFMPISVEISKAVALDEQAELGIQNSDFQLPEENVGDIQS